MPQKTESCEDCGRLIGKRETPWVHGELVVCSACWLRLQSATLTVEQAGKVWNLPLLLVAALAILGAITFFVSIQS